MFLPILEPVDEDPDEWGPDHDDLIAHELSEGELLMLVAEGNLHGRFINTDDDLDNGMDL